MPRHGREECFACGETYQLVVMPKLFGERNAVLRDIAQRFRKELKRPEKEVTENDRLCMNCRKKAKTLESSNNGLIEVIFNCPISEHQTCLFCNRTDNIHELPESTKVHVFVETGIFIPKQTKACYEHLTEDKTKVLQPLLNGLVGASRPIRMNGREVVKWMHLLRTEVKNYARRRFDDENSFSQEDFVCMTSLSKEDFRDLWTSLKVNTNVDGRFLKKSDLIMFLTKMRQGLTDEFLKTMFQYSSRRSVSHAIETARKVLMRDFVPKNLGLGSVTREQFIENHVSSFANELYYRDENGQLRPEKVAIAVVDGTYVYIPKVSNFKVLRQSYCLHKGRHLFKPVMVTAPDGYILDVHGPYFSDSQNNDAALLINEFKKKEVESLKNWLKPNDILLVDRGYRDSFKFLESIGINPKMPKYLPKGNRQHSYEESNASRLVTKSRWIVEARNGHVKLKFKYLKDIIPVHHLPHIGDFFRICCALMNKYFPVIDMQLSAEFANLMLERASMPNEIQIKVEIENWLRIRGAWVPMTAANLPIFPKLSVEYLKDLTMGVYQLKLAKSYVQDKIRREGEFEFQVLIYEDGLLHARIYSRFTNSAKYQIFIAYKEPTGRDTEAELEEIQVDPIVGWYCQCKTGARTLGCCAHIASVLWYLGYARHEPNLRYPSDRLLSVIEDAGQRSLPSFID